MWGGYFREKPYSSILRFTSKTDIYGYPGADYYLFKYEIITNYAYTLMLFKQGIMEKRICKQIIHALIELEETTALSLEGYEDIQSYVESYLITKTGSTPHICRSRNDQIVTLEILFIRDNILKIQELIINLIEKIVEKAFSLPEVCIPMYTHWRQADITNIRHLWTSYANMLIRDLENLIDLFKMSNTCPLGSSAITGCSLDIDREFLADLLGFYSIQYNTIDSISSRWEWHTRYLSALAILMKHLATISKDLILYSMDEIDIIKLNDKISTGSSSLPHKRNPDPLEIINGKASKVASLLQSALSLGGEPGGYHRETQEGKWYITVATEDVVDSLKILPIVLDNLTINHDRANKVIKEYLVSPEIANKIAAMKAIPFREAHRIVGEWLRENETQLNMNSLIEKLGEHDITLSTNEIKILKSYLNIQNIPKLKRTIGGPGDTQNNIEFIMGNLAKLKKKHQSQKNYIKKAEKKLCNLVNKILDNKTLKI